MLKLSDAQALDLLKKYKIPVPRYIITKKEDQAANFAKKYPVVMKLCSPQIVHKTDAKAVLVGIKDERALRQGFQKLLGIAKKKRARLEGILIQEQIEGHEIIIGSKRDPQFGPTILFGLGGIFVEVLKDVTFRIIPIERRDAQEMIQEIKAYKILKGTRGEKPINFKALEDCLLKVSKMVDTEKRAIQELDINPLFANEKGCIAADVRIFV